MLKKIKNNFRIGFKYKNRALRITTFILDLIAIIIMGNFIDISKPTNMIIVILICTILKMSGYIDMKNIKDKGE